MITEIAVLEFLVLETSEDGVDWIEWTGALREIDGGRGGKRSGASTTVEVGFISATLINSGDPLTDSGLKPNLRVRLRHRDAVDVDENPLAVFTGRIVDLFTIYRLDKQTGVTTTIVNLTAADSVRSHGAITVAGAVTSGGVGYEQWAARINRLAASALTDVETKTDDLPIVRYAI